MGARYPISGRIRTDLRAVERKLARIAAEAEGELADACGSTLEAGGKRLRPALVLVCGMCGAYDLEALTAPAIAVELIHMASLVHDDILDDAPTRRGLPSVHAKWGANMGVATGDYLFSRAFETVAGSAVCEAPLRLAETALDLTTGELMQRAGARTVDVTRDDYLARIRAKTASLFKASCELGAAAAGSDADTVKALGSYGENLGMAFQIYDDVLDVTGDSAVLGKDAGADLRDGTLTLPMMLAAEQLGSTDWLSETMGTDAPQGAVDRALETIGATDGPARAKDVARQYVLAAIESAGAVGSSQARRMLSDIGNYVIERYD